GSAFAESPLMAEDPFVSTRTRAEVQAEARADRAHRPAGIEWALQQNDQQTHASGLSRAQVAAEYIAAREQVREMTSESSGSEYFSRAPLRSSTIVMAGDPR
ncbi:MAG TPA: hypothetical protein VLJ86_25210, partial [Ramlibacter sp.]|nr:hypothetical protein [Ramlibacter sp.]